MDAPGQIYYFQMIILLFVMAFFTIWIGRVAQWFMIRKKYPAKTIFILLAASFVVAYLLSLICWFCWPQQLQPMFGMLFLPAVLSEIILLTLTALLLKKKKN